MWTTIAEGTSLSDLAQMVADRELGKGTPVRFEMTLKYPTAHAFDLAGAESIFRSAMPEGLMLKDVYSPDDKYKVVIDCESDPVWIGAIVGFVRVHWLAISLITIGVIFALGFLVTAIKIKAEISPAFPTVWIIAILAAIVLVVYFIAKAGVEAPGIKIGGGT